MTGFALVSTTVASEEAGMALASALVEARLAACVQMTPISSVYRWEDRVQRAREHLLLCKIASNRFAEVAAAIAARHDYEVPEIVMVPIEAAAPAYKAWLAAETSG